MIFAFMIIPLMLIGCAKDIGQPTVDSIGGDIEIAAQGLTVLGLTVAQNERPDIVPKIDRYLNVVVAQARLYEDGEASISDFVNTLNTALDKINDETGVIDPEKARYIKIGIDTASLLFNKYITDLTLPDEASVYIKALADGIEAGQAQWRDNS